MTLFIIKFLVTSFIIVLVSEIAKPTDRIGVLSASLFFKTIAMIWLYGRHKSLFCDYTLTFKNLIYSFRNRAIER